MAALSRLVKRLAGWQTHYVNRQERWEHYERFVLGVISDREYDFIRRSLQRAQLARNQAFIDEVERMIGRRIEHRAPGNQPAKTTLK